MRSWNRLCVVGFIGLGSCVSGIDTTDPCASTLIYSKKSSGYQQGAEVIFQGALYKATQWVSESPSPNATSGWAKQSVCTKGFENGKPIQCAGVARYKDGDVTKGDAIVNVKGSLFKFTCPAYGISGNPSQQDCDVKGYCGTDCSDLPMFAMAQSSPTGDFQYLMPDGLIRHISCKFPTYFTEFSKQCEEKGICAPSEAPSKPSAESYSAVMSPTTELGGGGAAAPVISAPDCKGVEVLTGNGKSLTGDIVIDRAGTPHLIRCKYLNWVSPSSYSSCEDVGPCKAGSVATADPVANTGGSKVETPPSGPVDCAGAPMLKENEKTDRAVLEKTPGKFVLITCKESESVTKWFTPAGCVERECVAGSIKSADEQLVSCKNLRTYDGAAAVKAGEWRAHDKKTNHLMKYNCETEGVVEGCHKIGRCDDKIDDDLSLLPQQDCSQLKRVDATKWYQTKERAIDAGHFVYEALEAVQMKSGILSVDPKWAVVGPCSKETTLGVSVDCSSFLMFNANDKYCPSQSEVINVKHDGNAYSVKYCMKDTGSNPATSDGFAPLGACKPGTSEGEAEIDCEDYIEYVPGTEYVPSSVQLKLKSGKTVTPLNKPMKLKSQEGLAFQTRGDLGWAGKKPAIGGEEYKYVGKCKKGTEGPLQIDCSQPTRAFKLLPEMILPALASPTDIVLVFDKDHTLYQQNYYYMHPFEDVVPMKMLTALGICVKDTEHNSKFLAAEEDCTGVPVWNPRSEYFNNKQKTFKVQRDGNVYQMKGEWAGWREPELNSEWIGKAHCKEGTTSTKIEKGPYDYSVDQTMGIMKCCTEAGGEFCGYYMGGQFQCYKNREDLDKKMHLKRCPWIDMGTAKSFVSENYASSGMETNGVSTCEDVKNSLMMDFYPGEIVKSRGSHAWNHTHVAPYFDVGLATFPPLDKLVKDETAGWIKYFHAAFVTQSVRPGTKCKGDFGSVIPYQVGPRMWGEDAPGKSPGSATYNYDKLNTLRNNGGDWAVSFGGYNGVELADSKQCEGSTLSETVANVKKAYGDVIKHLGVSHANWDIEAGSIQALTHKNTHFVYRALAINELVNDNEDLLVSWTLPVSPTGLTDDGMAFLETMMELGTRISYVMGMTMDYGDLVCPTKSDDPSAKTMHQCEMTALEGLAKQVYETAKKYNRADPSWTSYKDVYPVIGSIPMIGQNDVKDEIFTYKDATDSIKAYEGLKLGVASFWAITRDKAQGDNTYKPPQSYADVLAKANPNKGRAATSFADSTFDGVTEKGNAFVFSDIFSKYSKTAEADNNKTKNTFIGVPESKANRMNAARYEARSPVTHH